MQKEIAGFVLDVNTTDKVLRVKSSRGRLIELTVQDSLRIYRRSRRASQADLVPGDWVNVRPR